MQGTERLTITEEDGKFVIRESRVVTQALTPSALSTIWEPNERKVKLLDILNYVGKIGGPKAAQIVVAAVRMGKAELHLFFVDMTGGRPLTAESAKAFHDWNQANADFPIIVEVCDAGTKDVTVMNLASWGAR